MAILLRINRSQRLQYKTSALTEIFLAEDCKLSSENPLACMYPIASFFSKITQRSLKRISDCHYYYWIFLLQESKSGNLVILHFYTILYFYILCFLYFMYRRHYCSLVLPFGTGDAPIVRILETFLLCYAYFFCCGSSL